MNPKQAALIITYAIFFALTVPITIPPQTAQIAAITDPTFDQNSSSDLPAEVPPWQQNQSVNPPPGGLPVGQDPNTSANTTGNTNAAGGSAGQAKAAQTADGGDIPNPIGYDNLADLAVHVGEVLMQIAIPIAMLIIIWSGIRMITSRGNTEAITSARKTLWYAILGLAVLFIGQGFVTLIQSILALRNGG
ncbi:MAG: hypothetical protein A3A33_05000 [Candidatus Yanofskybacteria bacterium RIFCSPLOWO2_01_FULL_49_25]|uniref:Uncharacterized protein n=1 Tax=Candidatus Yanofskybacteria bacterium RIFCSPLOWO2_01_FULL_49_25 TaxID=1802701 RepID=A0A1F8GSB7_9BACT|nr:MAG: hypothetical protein A3A33_05000 [Candidatus Yanofskybacteria bacterium RIFCSPLOWO2_01_FULL_49_25]